MKLPFIILSYGDFEENKKLFSYENEGVHILPIFSSPDIAQIFIRGMTRTLKELGDNRVLVPQVCSELRYAHSMLVTIATIASDLTTIIFDPAPPGSIDIHLSGGNKLIQMKRGIDEIIEEIQDELSVLDDEEEGSPKQK